MVIQFVCTVRPTVMSERRESFCVPCLQRSVRFSSGLIASGGMRNARLYFQGKPGKDLSKTSTARRSRGKEQKESE